MSDESLYPRGSAPRLPSERIETMTDPTKSILEADQAPPKQNGVESEPHQPSDQSTSHIAFTEPQLTPTEVRIVEGGVVSAEAYPNDGSPDWKSQAIRLQYELDTANRVAEQASDRWGKTLLELDYAKKQNAFLMEKLDASTERCFHCGNTTRAPEKP